MSDLFEEIREDVLKAKYKEVWEHYGKYIIALLVVIVVGLSGFFVNKDYINKKNSKDTSYLFALLQSYESKNLPKFNDEFTYLNESASGNLNEIAILKKADYEIAEGNLSKAYEVLNELYSDNNAYKPYRDYAELLLNYIIYRYPASDFSDQAIIANISSSNIFYYSIIEIRSLGLVEQERYSEAKNELEKIVTSSDAKVEHKKFAADLIRLLEEGDKV